MKPMLAKPYHTNRIYFPCYTQPKLDGVRGLSLPDSPTLQARPKPPDFKLIHWNKGILPHIDEAIKKLRRHLPSLVFDGELYNHSLTLQQINSRVAVKRTSPHKHVSDISFYIFDFVDPLDPQMPQSRRADILNSWAQTITIPGITFVPLTYCATKRFSELIYKQHLNEKYEGTIYRLPASPYASVLTCGNKENRVWDLQKRKLTQDIVCTIVDMEESTKRPGHLKSFWVKTPTGETFDVGTGYSIADRKTYWELGEECIGGKVRVTYRCLSDQLKPLEPRAALVEL